MSDPFSLRKKILVACLILSVLPFFLLADWPSANTGQGVTLKEYTLFATSLFGFVGSVLMLWQFFLGTRVLIRYIFPDMVWALKLHRWLGTYGSLFTWLHPLLSFYALSVSFWYIFIPDFGDRYETYITFGRIAFLLFVIIWVTSAVIRGRIGYRPWKYLHMSSYVLLPLVFLHAVANGLQLGQSRPLLYYWYFLTFVYLVLVAVRIGYQFGYGKRPYTIVEAKTNGDIILLTLQPEAAVPDAMVTTKPGQYVYVQFDTVFSENHPFTVTHYDYSTHHITLAIRVFGRFTNKMLNLDNGEQLMLEGPYGVFTDEVNQIGRDNRTPIVMFAGGIGVTPFIQHISSAASNNITLFNCNRDPESTLFADMLRKQLRNRYIDVFSRVKPTARPRYASNTEYGRITEAKVRKYLRHTPESYLYYVCGPKQFMEKVIDILDNLGVPRDQIRAEEFSF